MVRVFQPVLSADAQRGDIEPWRSFALLRIGQGPGWKTRATVIGAEVLSELAAATAGVTAHLRSARAASDRLDFIDGQLDPKMLAVGQLPRTELRGFTQAQCRDGLGA